MKGWKTKTSAILSIGYGVGGFILEMHDADTMMAFLVAGLAAVGIGHKIEKAGKLGVGIVFVLVGVTASGCAPLLTGNSLSEIIAELGKDKASFCLAAQVDPALQVGAAPDVLLRICRANSDGMSITGIEADGRLILNHNVLVPVEQPQQPSEPTAITRHEHGT